ncbi:HigA family addiction module antitoxin [Brevundimonas sp. 374]|uniref:HigA family addiction module antitoxin n=1 Tax=Brevundimonas sp. 374 TaxID=1150400 RepID=UPI00088F83B1|nr:HigA family addiction module antitoxin [Brevundimonas sp. 374]SDQ28116.1 addiction module antidote protein, HigA family [Brevundimonas sp. 374]
MPDRPSTWTPATPAELLRGKLEGRDSLTQDQLAQALGVTRYSVNQILNDKRNITAEMALRLERVFGETAEFWMDVQRDVDLHRARHRLGKTLDALPVVKIDSGPPIASLDSLFPKDDAA